MDSGLYTARPSQLCPPSTTNLVVVGATNGAGEYMYSDVFACGDDLHLDPGCSSQVHAEVGCHCSVQHRYKVGPAVDPRGVDGT